MEPGGRKGLQVASVAEEREDFRARPGRILRVAYGFVCIAVGALSGYSWWLCLAFVGAGVFGLFEAARGWCFLRACGIRTRW
jgi:hypothetical protein